MVSIPSRAELPCLTDEEDLLIYSDPRTLSSALCLLVIVLLGLLAFLVSLDTVACHFPPTYMAPP